LPEKFHELTDWLDAQLRRAVYDPLLRVEPVDLPAAFQNVVIAYANSLRAVSALALTALGGDIARLFELAERELVLLEDRLQRLGPAAMEGEAVDSALAGIRLRRRVTRGLRHAPVLTAGLEVLGALVAQTMALSTIGYGLTVRARRENLEILAHWSRAYAVKAYAAAKAAWLLAAPSPAEAAPAVSDPDDRELADRGLAHYRRIFDSE